MHTRCEHPVLTPMKTGTQTRSHSNTVIKQSLTPEATGPVCSQQYWREKLTSQKTTIPDLYLNLNKEQDEGETRKGNKCEST